MRAAGGRQRRRPSRGPTTEQSRSGLQSDSVQAPEVTRARDRLSSARAERTLAQRRQAGVELRCAERPGSRISPRSFNLLGTRCYVRFKDPRSAETFIPAGRYLCKNVLHPEPDALDDRQSTQLEGLRTGVPAAAATAPVQLSQQALELVNRHGGRRPRQRREGMPTQSRPGASGRPGHTNTMPNCLRTHRRTCSLWDLGRGTSSEPAPREAHAAWSNLDASQSTREQCPTQSGWRSCRAQLFVVREPAGI